MYVCINSFTYIKIYNYLYKKLIQLLYVYNNYLFVLCANCGFPEFKNKTKEHKNIKRAFTKHTHA